jgi:hypothetical protein
LLLLLQPMMPCFMACIGAVKLQTLLGCLCAHFHLLLTLLLLLRTSWHRPRRRLLWLHCPAA